MASWSAASSIILADMSVLQVLNAASKVHGIWVLPSQSTRQRLQLLQQPPPAVCSGPVQEAVSSSTKLLGALGAGLAAAAAQQPPRKAQDLLEAIYNHCMPGTAAKLTAWLQQRPVLTAQFCGSSSNSSSSSAYCELWVSCTRFFMAVANLCGACEAVARGRYAAELAHVLDSAGERKCSSSSGSSSSSTCVEHHLSAIRHVYRQAVTTTCATSTSVLNP
jgi:hypothetical protein